LYFSGLLLELRFNACAIIKYKDNVMWFQAVRNKQGDFENYLSVFEYAWDVMGNT